MQKAAPNIWAPLLLFRCAMRTTYQVIQNLGTAVAA